MTKTALVMDPSGNFKEGDGTTGWVLIDENQNIIQFGQLMSRHFNSRPAYHAAHLKLIEAHTPTVVVCENFVLYGHKAHAQINSELETPRLLGVIEHHCYEEARPYFTQKASDVKARWEDKILVRKGVIVQENSRSYINGMLLSRHIKDALRHAMHYTSFNKEWKKI